MQFENLIVYKLNNCQNPNTQKVLGFLIFIHLKNMTDENKIKTQQEWTQLVSLTPEQVRELILRKFERGAIYAYPIKRKLPSRNNQTVNQ